MGMVVSFKDTSLGNAEVYRLDLPGVVLELTNGCLVLVPWDQVLSVASTDRKTLINALNNLTGEG